MAYSSGARLEIMAAGLIHHGVSRLPGTAHEKGHTSGEFDLGRLWLLGRSDALSDSP